MATSLHFKGFCKKHQGEDKVLNDQ